MENDGWAQLFGMTDAGATAVADSEPAAPVDDAALTTEAAADPGEPTPVEQESVAPEIEATAPEPEPASEPEPEPEPQTFDWRQDPEAQAALQEAEQFRQIKARLAEAQRIQAQQRDMQEIADLSDGDAERQQRLTGLLARQVSPIRQELQQATQYATTMEKATAALHIALRAEADEALVQKVMGRMDALMAVDGTDVMERLAFGDRDRIQAHQQELSARDARIAELERQLASRTELAARAATNADAVDGGGGSAAALDKTTALTNGQLSNDDWFKVFFSSAA